jgi:uncharacterized membrane protein
LTVAVIGVLLERGDAIMPTTQQQIFDTARSWAARLGLGDALGGQRTAWDARRRQRIGAVVTFGLLGAGVLARGAQKLGVRRLTGVGAGRRAVDAEDSIEVDAPIDRVFAYWERIENFPQFMPSVLEVRETGHCRSHWKVAGPMGSTVEWDAEQTVDEPNRLIGWKMVAGSLVEHAGIVRFEAVDAGRTRVDVRLSYNPVGGAIGHGVASILGVDPRHHLRADLPRMKQAVESKRPA